MNTYIYFSHEQQKSIERDLASVKDWQEFIIDYGDALCKDDVLIISGKCYCHNSLGEFLNDLYQQHSNEVCLSEINEHFQDELCEIQLNAIRNWPLGLINQRSNTSKRKGTTNTFKRVIFSEEQIIYIMNALANSSTDE